MSIHCDPRDGYNSGLISDEKDNQQQQQTDSDHLFKAAVAKITSCDTQSGAAALKQMLNIQADIDPGLFECIIQQLCRLLMDNRMYGEALYYSFTPPFFYKRRLSTTEDRFRQVKDAAFREIVPRLNKQQHQVNTLIFDSKFEQTNNLMETIKSCCHQNLEVYPDYLSAFEEIRYSAVTPHLFIICNYDIGESIKVIKEFRDQFPQTGIPLCLHVSNLQDAIQIFQQHRTLIDYILYNDKMIYAVLYHTLNKNFFSMVIPKKK